jgi:hypothetical protein
VLAVIKNPRIAIADHVWLREGDIRLATFSTCMVVPRAANDMPVFWMILLFLIKTASID